MDIQAHNFVDLYHSNKESVNMMIKANSQSIRKTIRTLGMCLLSITILGALTSCTSNIAKLPETWSKNTPIPAGDCADISGTYRNAGLGAPDNKDKLTHPQYLSDFLVKDTLVNGRKHKWVTHIELVGVKQGKLTAFFKKQDETIHSEELQQGQDFACTANGIEFTSHYTQLYNIGGGIGWQTTTLACTKTIDGSLVIRKQKKEKGLSLVIIPFTDEVIQYFRFPAMDETQ